MSASSVTTCLLANLRCDSANGQSRGKNLKGILKNSFFRSHRAIDSHRFHCDQRNQLVWSGKHHRDWCHFSENFQWNFFTPSLIFLNIESLNLLNPKFWCKLKKFSGNKFSKVLIFQVTPYLVQPTNCRRLHRRPSISIFFLCLASVVKFPDLQKYSAFQKNDKK